MKAYNKPEFYVAEFRMNDVVASCDRLPTGDYEYQKTTIDCLASTSDVIFNSTSIGCEHVVDPSKNGTDYAWFQDTKREYADVPDDVLYFGWANNKMEGRPDPNNKLFNALHDIFSSLLNTTDKVIHVGEASGYLQQLYSHS